MPDVALKPSFTGETKQALLAVRRALAELVAAVPGEMQRPTDLQKALGVDSKICWQIFNVIRGEGSLAAAIHVPTLQAAKRVITSAKDQGVPEGLIEGVSTSLMDFERVVEAHAGARADFDAMVAAVAPGESTSQIELRHRRSVYRGLSHIWGTQIDTVSTATFVRPSETGTDRLILSSKRGLRRLRPDAHIRVYGYRASLDMDDPFNDSAAIEPGSIERFGAPLIPDLCSQPLPELTTRADEEGWITCELAGESIGRLSDLDLAFGMLSRSVPEPRDLDGRAWIGSNVLTTTPTGLLVTDFLVHRPSYGVLDPELMVFAHVQGIDAPGALRRFALPLREKIVSIGRADQMAQQPDNPAVPEMLRHACERVGWELSEFDCYRVRVQYPVLHSVVRLFAYIGG